MWFWSCALAASIVVQTPSFRDATHAREVLGVATVAGQEWVFSRHDGDIYSLSNPSLDDRLLRAPWASAARVTLGDLDGDGSDDAVTYLDGEVVAYDLTTLDELARVSVPMPSLPPAFEVADLDADGTAEILFQLPTNPRELHVIDTSGVTWWVRTFSGNTGTAVVQADGDPELEVVAGRTLRDGVTGMVELQLGVSGRSYAAADLDGDGVDEVIADTYPTRTAVSLATGQPLWVRGSPGFTYPYDLDGDGAAELLELRSDGVFLVDSQGVQTGMLTDDYCHPSTYRMSGGEIRVQCGGRHFTLAGVDMTSVMPQGPGQRIDLDRDGTDEVLWLGSTMAYDLSGNWLNSVSPFTGIQVGDWDLDGVPDLVARASEVWGWSASGGFYLDHPLSSPPASGRQIIGDADGNGGADLLIGQPRRTLGGIGGSDVWFRPDMFQSSAHFLTRALTWDAVDLDGDGVSEVIVTLPRGVVSVFDLLGQELSSVPGGAFAVVPGPQRSRLLVTDGPSVALYRFSAGSLSQMADEQPPDLEGTAWYTHGRVWVRTPNGIVAWDPTGGDPWLFQTPALLYQAPLVAGGEVWLTGAGFFERWPLP